MTQTTFEVVEYYVDLLIIQYHGKPKARGEIRAAASALIQPQIGEYTLSCNIAPLGGSFSLSWEGNTLGPFPWNVTADTIQTAFRAIPGLEDLTVSGTFTNSSSGLKIKISFVGVTPVVTPVTVSANSLIGAGSELVNLKSLETDKVLPLAIQDGFNLFGDNVAVGVQLDILGKYIGVERAGLGFTGQIVLNDEDFLSLIQLAIARNNLGSSLADIDNFINVFFAGNILVFDFANMQMSYMLSTAVGSIELVQRVISEGLLPKPMAVGVGSIIYAPIIDAFFGFRTYTAPSSFGTPFNKYDDYRTDWLWMKYSYTLSF